MRNVRGPAWVVLGLATALGLSACGGFMKAMTMTYGVAPGVALDDLGPGAEVDFSVKEEGGAYTVTEIRPSD